jgi:hypothetical protein
MKAELAELLSAWPRLSQEARKAILAIVRAKK